MLSEILSEFEEDLEAYKVSGNPVDVAPYFRRLVDELGPAQGTATFIEMHHRICTPGSVAKWSGLPAGMEPTARSMTVRYRGFDRPIRYRCVRH